MYRARTSDAPPLIAGPYQAPRCRVGDWLDDEILGAVEVMGWTEAPLSWPRIRRKGPAGPVMTAELARAVRTESAVAVAYWWGTSTDQVRRWRQALGVERLNEGTRRALREARAAMDPATVARNLAALQTPEVRARSAEGRRRAPLTPEGRAALQAAGREVGSRPKPPQWGERAHAWMEAGKAQRRKPRPP